MTNQFLPIGTIVKLLNLKKKIMVTGFLMKNENQVYDYCGCIYPEGINDEYKRFHFNKNDIIEVVKLGLVDKETQEVLNKVNNYKNNTAN